MGLLFFVACHHPCLHTGHGCGVAQTNARYETRHVMLNGSYQYNLDNISNNTLIYVCMHVNKH